MTEPAMTEPAMTEPDTPGPASTQESAPPRTSVLESALPPPAASEPREPQWRVAPSAIGLWTVQEIIGALVFLIPAMAASAFVPDTAADWLVTATDILPWALAVVFLVGIVVLPRYKYAIHRWEVTPDGIYTLTGWLSRTWILVPISRIQTVDVTRGPLQRMFGLASVSVRTASAHGSVEIDQLAAYTAAQVADDLSKRANLYDDDAT